MVPPPQAAPVPLERDRSNRTAATDSSARPAVRVTNLSKRFGDGPDAVVAVDDVSFEIPSGSIVGLLGPNGAGKTTLIKCLLGLVVPDSGRVEIDGVSVHDAPRRAYGRVEAMMEGARNLYWRLTVRENLRYFASIAGEDPDTVADRHEDLIDRFGLTEYADTQVRNVSRGVKQRAAIASTLAHDVAVTFLDEPTLGLDVESSLTLRNELRTLASEADVTVVLSSHDMDVIEDVCDRVIVIDDGAVVADDTVENLVGALEVTGYRITVGRLDERTLERLDATVPIDEITHVGDRTRLELSTDSREFYRLVAVLESEDVRLSAVETLTPAFEDVFVRLTGGDP
ncbi:ABC transporter ATP-binding protein [Natronobiforma cellulositropha]|uniref:ABC transporter ATP-binding protein n=1 Tax=Natronobiforma cellulositropha TaxID=1679076 RepID=UPI0021D5CF11|nr:ABC transporter ATP-binding protein [Natronobiforma cellulositropha]